MTLQKRRLRLCRNSNNLMDAGPTRSVAQKFCRGLRSVRANLGPRPSSARLSRISRVIIGSGRDWWVMVIGRWSRALSVNVFGSQ